MQCIRTYGQCQKIVSKYALKILISINCGTGPYPDDENPWTLGQVETLEDYLKVCADNLYSFIINPQNEYDFLLAITGKYGQTEQQDIMIHEAKEHISDAAIVIFPSITNWCWNDFNEFSESFVPELIEIYKNHHCPYRSFHPE